MPANGFKPKLFLLAFLILKIASAQVLSSSSVDSINSIAFNLQFEDVDSALALNLSLLPHLSPKSDSITVANVYSTSGTLFMLKGDYQKALYYQFKCLRIREALGNFDKIASTQRNIANTYYYLRQYGKAKEFHKKSISNIRKSKADETKLAYAYNDLGAVYASEDLNDSSFFYFHKALTLISSEDKSSDARLADLLSNIGYYFEKRGTLDSAKAYYDRAVPIYSRYNETANLCWIQHHLGLIEEYSGNFNAAAQALRQAMFLARNIGDIQQESEISQSFTNVYAKMGNSDSTLYFLNRFMILNDSLTRQKTARNIQEVETKYQVEKKDQALRLSQEINARVNAENDRNKALAYALLALLLLTGITAFILLRNYRQKQYISSMELDLKNRKIKELLKEHESASYAAMLEGQEKERQRIAQNLHDSLGGTLAALKMGLHSESADSKENNISLVKIAMAEVRSISHNLANGVLEKHGLHAALQELKALIDGSGNMHLELNLDTKTFELGLKKEIELYRIVQELTSNTLKHAQANTITLSVRYTVDKLTLTYEDDGKGFDMGRVKTGLGLGNLEQRLQKINGSYQLGSQKGQGTTVVIEVFHG